MWCVPLAPLFVLTVFWMALVLSFMVTLRGCRGATGRCGGYGLALTLFFTAGNSLMIGCFLLAVGSSDQLLVAAFSSEHFPLVHTWHSTVLPPVFVRLPFSPRSYFHSSLCHTSDLFFLPLPKLQTSCFLSFVLLPPPPSSSSTRSPSSSSEPLEEHHVAQLLRCLSTDLSLGRRQLPLDRALAHHLHQCSYHLRLFRNWLVSGQDPIEYLHGQPLAPSSIPQPHALINLCSRSPWDCACSVVDFHALPPNVSACLPVSVMQIASWSSVSCLDFLALFLFQKTDSLQQSPQFFFPHFLFQSIIFNLLNLFLFI